MSFVSFNPTLARSSSETGSTVTPAPTLGSGWSWSVSGVNLNLSDNTGYVTAAFTAPAGIRAVSITFMARYMPTTTGNLYEGPQFISPQISVYVGRGVASQLFSMWTGPYEPVGTGPFFVNLDIDVTGIEYGPGGNNVEGTVVPEEPIAVDDDITTIEITFPAGVHFYEAEPPNDKTASQFGVTNFIVSPLFGTPKAFWTRRIGTKETL